MNTLRVAALVSAVLAPFSLAAPQGTFAADLGGYSVKDVPPPPPSGRAFYLKGTIGMSNASFEDYTAAVYATGNFTKVHEDIKSGPIFGMGIGVEHNRWLRFDVTGEYRGKQVMFAQDYYRNGPCGVAGNCGANEITADMESWVGLANAYIDLGTFRGITPYVGGGIGFAAVSVNGLKDVNVPQNSVWYGADHTEYNFAWALYAGLSYDVTSQFTMDFGYRYIDLGDALSGNMTAFSGGTGTGYTFEDVTSHDLLVSGRWRLDAPAQPVYALK